MERLLTLLTPRRPPLAWRALLSALLWLTLGVAHAATPLNGAWRQVRAGDTPAAVMAEYHEGALKSSSASVVGALPANTVTLARVGG